MLEQKYKLSKISSNSLNFITKDSEDRLLDKPQPEEIINIIRLTYIILGEDGDQFEGNDIIKDLFSTIYSKLNVDSLSK